MTPSKTSLSHKLQSMSAAVYLNRYLSQLYRAIACSATRQLGCATSTLLKMIVVSSQTSKEILSEDQIVAFGRPAQALPKTPNATMVIVGEKNSYVLTQGGTR